MERISVGKTYHVAWDREEFEVVVHSRAIAQYNNWACMRSDNQASIVLPPEAFKSMSDLPLEVIPPASGPEQHSRTAAFENLGPGPPAAASPS